MKDKEHSVSEEYISNLIKTNIDIYLCFCPELLELDNEKVEELQSYINGNMKDFSRKRWNNYFDFTEDFYNTLDKNFDSFEEYMTEKHWENLDYS